MFIQVTCLSMKLIRVKFLHKIASIGFEDASNNIVGLMIRHNTLMCAHSEESAHSCAYYRCSLTLCQYQEVTTEIILSERGSL